MRVVLDANIYISALISTLGNPRIITKRWEQRDFEVLITEDIINEVARVIRYPHITKRHNKGEKKIRSYLKLLSTQATLVEVNETLDIIKYDETDNRYLECAVAGKADYIVSGDNHLLSIGEYKGIIILSPAAFVALLDAAIET
jgi:putative PIN family toxin of toxin-antitoxin system